jgi:hypothetical protein
VRVLRSGTDETSVVNLNSRDIRITDLHIGINLKARKFEGKMPTAGTERVECGTWERHFGGNEHSEGSTNMAPAFMEFAQPSIQSYPDLAVPFQLGITRN